MAVGLDKIKREIEENDKMTEAAGSLHGIRGEAFKKIGNEAKEQLKLKQELAQLEQQKKMERRKINEKQIRSLRNRFSARAVGGALLSENPRGVGLGNDTGLPTKLGTA